VPPAGVAADLGHLERKSDVKGYVMEVGSKPIDNLKECLEGCHLVLVPAGMPRKPGMTRDDLFKVNADIAKGIVEACAKYCPDAMLGMVVNPVNSIVPAMAELYKKKGLDPLKIVGITTLDVVRANKSASHTARGVLRSSDRTLVLPVNVHGFCVLVWFVGEITGKNPNYISAGRPSVLTIASSKMSMTVPVVGGHAGITILPLFSQDKADSAVLYRA
ncbi:MDH2, partial [Symbiodinium sp. KB8]